MTDMETGRACSGIGKRPGVYTKVANFMDFIAFNFDRFQVDPNAWTNKIIHSCTVQPDPGHAKNFMLRYLIWLKITI